MERVRVVILTEIGDTEQEIGVLNMVYLTLHYLG
jgi:hypothetical protein